MPKMDDFVDGLGDRDLENLLSLNSASNVKGISRDVLTRFQADCDRVVKLKARNARPALNKKYSNYGMWCNILMEMGFGRGEAKIIMECDKYQDLCKDKPLAVREMLVNSLDIKYKGSKDYAVYGEELRRKLGLMEDGK